MGNVKTRAQVLTVLVAATGVVAAACSRPGATSMEKQLLDEGAETSVDQHHGATTVAGDQPLKIGVVTDVGRIDDRGFNHSAWEGAQQGAAAVGGEASYIETQSGKDYGKNINAYIDQDVDIIVTVGFALGEATTAAAKANPDIVFIGVDQDQQEVLPNLAGLISPADHSGFLAGALAGLLTQSNIVAAILGTERIPPVVAYKEGWERGARHTNPHVTTLSTYHPGELDVVFTDPDWGAEAARSALDQGADVVFTAAGGTGNGALLAVAEAEKAYCIGVDIDQWHTLPGARPCLVTSALRHIGPGIAQLVTAVHNNGFSGGNTVGTVGLAPFHDFDNLVTTEMRDTLDAVAAGLKDGSITTGYGP